MKVTLIKEVDFLPYGQNRLIISYDIKDVEKTISWNIYNSYGKEVVLDRDTSEKVSEYVDNIILSDILK